MGHHGSSWVIMGHHGSSWVIMGHHGSSWVIMGHHGSSWADLGLCSWMPQLLAEQTLQVQPQIAFHFEFATTCHCWLPPLPSDKDPQVRPESHGSSEGHSCSNRPSPGFGASCSPEEGPKLLHAPKPFTSFTSFTGFIWVPSIFTKNTKTQPVQLWLGF